MKKVTCFQDFLAFCDKVLSSPSDDSCMEIIRSLQSKNASFSPKDVNLEVKLTISMLNKHFEKMYRIDYLVNVIVMLMFHAGALVERGARIEEKTSMEFVEILGKLFKMPVTGKFMEVLSRLPPPAQHFLSAHKSARKEVRKNKRIVDVINNKTIRYSDGQIKMLHTLLDVLDDERVIVLNFDEKKAIEVEISGCSDMYQLDSHLQYLLVPDKFNKGDEKMKKCCYDVIRGASEKMKCHDVKYLWNTYNWSAILKEGVLSKDKTYWVWKEGTPSDIDKFDGKRVLVLGKPEYERGCFASRVFPSLKSSVKIIKEYTKEEYDKLMKNILEADDKKRKISEDFCRSRIVQSNRESDDVVTVKNLDEVKKFLKETKYSFLEPETFEEMKKGFEEGFHFLLCCGGTSTQYVKVDPKLLNPPEHHHDHDGCCGHDHGHDDDECDHEHHDGCNHDHHHHHHDGCNHDHHHHEGHSHQ